MILSFQKAQQRNYTLYNLNDNTGRIEILVHGKENKIQCKEGEKLHLISFELSKTGKKLHLKSGVYTFIKVGNSRRKVNSPKGYCFVFAFSKLDRCYRIGYAVEDPDI